MAKKINFSFDVSNLDEYIKQNADNIMLEAVASGKTIDLITLQPGIKHKETINMMGGDIVVQDGSNCTFNADGTVDFSQREIFVHPMKINESLCFSDLNRIYLSQLQKAGTEGDFILGDALAAHYTEKIRSFNEKELWMGETGATGHFIDGFIEILSNESSRIDITAGATAYDAPYTSSTIIAAVNAMIAGIPEEISENNNLGLFMSYKNYRLLVSALNAASNFVQMTVDGTGTSFVYPMMGNLTVYSTTGLSAEDYMVLTSRTNLVAGVDMANEYESIDFIYDRKTKGYDVVATWKLGAQIASPQFVVTNF